MSNLKNALTRKLGPLPAWAWLGLLAVGVWYYRSRMNASGAVGSTTDSGTGTGSVGTTGLQALAPDQSYYDPSDSGMFTTPQTSAPTVITKWRTRYKTRRTKPTVKTKHRKQNKGHDKKISVPRNHRKPTTTRNRGGKKHVEEPSHANHTGTRQPHQAAAKSHTRKARHKR